MAWSRRASPGWHPRVGRNLDGGGADRCEGGGEREVQGGRWRSQLAEDAGQGADDRLPSCRVAYRGRAQTPPRRPPLTGSDRGVKLVGATAHYVTPDLDEGPIIEQEIIRIDHTHDPRALATIGRDAEALALARAVRWHSERRVLLNEGSTVVFR